MRTLLWVVVAALVSSAEALINPNFTPVHLVAQSTQIADVELTEARPGAFTCRVTRTLKGDAPKVTGILGAQPGKGLLFVSTGDVALLHAGTQWYRLTRAAEGPWRVESQDKQLQATWAGGTEMLARCIEYILATPNASVPSATTERWAAPVTLTTNLPLAGLRVEGDFDNDGQLDILEPGKLLWNGTNVWAETGEPVQLLRSNAVGLAVCDINLDCRQDFVVFYRDAPPQVYFNRGWRTFGLSASLQLTNVTGNGCVLDLTNLVVGSQLFRCQRQGAPPLLLRVESSVPVTVWHGKQCLGAQRGGTWALPEPGLYRVEWKGRQREVRVLNQAVTVRAD